MRSAIIVAAGKGLRVGGDTPKQFMYLRKKPVLAHAIDAFLKTDYFQEIVLVVTPGYREYTRENIITPYFTGIAGNYEIKLVEGALERRESVYIGIQNLNDNSKTVCVHDGVRPLVSQRELREVVKTGERYGAATLVVPLKDTLKEVDEWGNVVKTLPRGNYRSAQTPQCFIKEVLVDAHTQYDINRLEATDDASLVEAQGVKVKTVEGSYRNLKITTPEDLSFAEVLLEMNE